jgi:hypothetical protein
LSSTTARNRGHAANFDAFGRHNLLTAALSARHARYRRRPPLAATSREIVDGARPNRRAIARNDSPPTNPREISSRSTTDNRNGDRTDSRTGDRRINRKCFATAYRPRPISLAINRVVDPCDANSAIRHRSNSDNRSAITTPPNRSNSIEGADALIP